MARHSFGGGMADWTFTTVSGVDGNDNLPQLVGGAVIQFFNLEDGGTQYTDLLDQDGNPTNQIVSSDGTGDRTIGQIPQFQGPDDVWSMWASANGGPRKLMQANDIGEALQELHGDET